jgi:hypothetical protein
MKSIKYMTHSLRYLWVPEKLLNPGENVYLLLDSKDLSKWRCDSFVQFL